MIGKPQRNVVGVSLTESSGAAAHDFSLTDKFGVEFAAVEGEIDVKVDPVESSLGGIHPFEILLEILSGKVRC